MAQLSNSIRSKNARVLVVSGEPFNKATATGITMSNLFLDIAPSELFQIFSADLKPIEHMVETPWRLTNCDLRFVRKLKGLVPKYFRRDEVSVHSDSQPNVGRVRGVSGSIRTAIVPWLDILPYDPPEQMFQCLDIFRPQVIYSLLGNIRLVRLVEMLSLRYAIPVVPHFMDDWISTYSVPGRSGSVPFSRAILNYHVSKMMRRAPFGFAIGDAMAKEYSEKFGVPHYAFMNPVQLGPEITCSKNKCVTIGYVGGLHLSRHANLMEASKVVNELNSQGHCVKLQVWSPKADMAQYGSALESAGAQCGSLAADEVADQIGKLDIALHVESFLRDEARYTRLSVSTKIPQYLAAGLPIIAFGPPSAASCQYIVENRCGIGVGETGQTLKDAILKLINSDSLRALYSKNGRSLARERHDAEKERKRFSELLFAAANSQSQVRTTG